MRTDCTRLLALAVVGLVAAGWFAPVTLGPVPAEAQSEAEIVVERSRVAPDLKFPTKAKELGRFTGLDMGLFKPEGEGKFPAVVVHHNCAGIGEHLRHWTRELLKQGYVVFVPDSLGPRRVKSVCTPVREMTFSRGLKDVFDALAHMKTLPFVDPDRIAIMGFSWGAMTSLMTSSDAIAARFPAGGRYTAAVSFYPHCWIPPLPQLNNPQPFAFLQPDVSRPTLVLMGGQDNETPPEHCLPRLQALKDKAAPVEWHVYPDAGHCWDCAEYNGLRKKEFIFGNSVEYRYDKAVTEESGKRALEFLARHLKKGS